MARMNATAIITSHEIAYLPHMLVDDGGVLSYFEQLLEGGIALNAAKPLNLSTH